MAQQLARLWVRDGGGKMTWVSPSPAELSSLYGGAPKASITDIDTATDFLVESGANWTLPWFVQVGFDTLRLRATFGVEGGSIAGISVLARTVTVATAVSTTSSPYVTLGHSHRPAISPWDQRSALVLTLGAAAFELQPDLDADRIVGIEFAAKFNPPLDNLTDTDLLGRTVYIKDVFIEDAIQSLSDA